MVSVKLAKVQIITSNETDLRQVLNDLIRWAKHTAGADLQITELEAKE